MNKLICIVLSCVMLVLIFTGCREKEIVKLDDDIVQTTIPQEEQNVVEDSITNTPIYKEYDTNISFDEMFSEIYEERMQGET